MACVKCLFTGRANFSNWVVITIFIIFRGLLIYFGADFFFCLYNYIMTNPQKGIWSLYNSQHDQSTMGIDPMNNISNNNKNTLCSYIISTLVIDFRRFVIQEFMEVESGNLGIQLSSYTFTRVMRQLDGAQTSPGIVFKEETSKGCH
jgi:hypothetical protein